MAVTVSALDGTVYEKLAEVTVPMLGEAHETKTYWQPEPQLTGERAANVCESPTFQVYVCGVVIPLLSTVT